MFQNMVAAGASAVASSAAIYAVGLHVAAGVQYSAAVNARGAAQKSFSTLPVNFTPTN